MKTVIMIGALLAASALNSDDKILQYSGVTTTYQEKEIFIKRLKHPNCLKVGITPEHVFGGDLAGKDVPKECIKSFVVSLGVVQPIMIDKDIKTVGELEVLKMLQLLDFEPENYILIDARRADFYKKLTIPHSVNIAKNDLVFDADFPEEFEKNLKILNITKKKNGTYDFSHAKEAIVYCNGAWCTQSAKAIKALVKLGYPKKKLLWYRGGLQDWISMGFTTQEP